jgi:hypothetical protein
MRWGYGEIERHKLLNIDQKKGVYVILYHFFCITISCSDFDILIISDKARVTIVNHHWYCAAWSIIAIYSPVFAQHSCLVNVPYLVNMFVLLIRVLDHLNLELIIPCVHVFLRNLKRMFEYQLVLLRIYLFLMICISLFLVGIREIEVATIARFTQCVSSWWYLFWFIKPIQVYDWQYCIVIAVVWQLDVTFNN